VLKVNEIDVYYGDLPALREVSIEVRQGEVVSVIGSNGAGKSTLLKAISGMLRLRHGTILLRSNDISQVPSSHIVEQGISHVPEGRQIFPTMTVLENLEMGAQFPRSKKVQHKTLEQVFGYFPRLKERLYQKAGTLSGGEQQMLAMGRGLMSVPALMMLDEPSLGLAPVLVSTIFEIIKKINQRGTPILLIEQNVFNSLKISDRGYVMENGRITLSGTGLELLENPHIRKTYLGL
jgi:branched-chain amino acid transport system ATP-binding protein